MTTKRTREAINAVQREATRVLGPLTDDEYLDACDELEDYFRSGADAKREERRRGD